ncbi:Alpha/Beta hydrolase protein [Phlebopus sp. FC_14]|nr:Alpha/Beta hydrolase protein [Phlebopus sp. FC_14]
MDIIAKNEETHIDKINLPSRSTSNVSKASLISSVCLISALSAFVPILDEKDKKAGIEKIEKKTFKYGQRYRHNLDVYYPLKPSLTSNGKVPILFFIYGGGYNTGQRQFPPPFDMGYRALAAFFAHRGFMTIIPDYRLVPEVRFPAASEDIRDAIVWVTKNAGTISTPSIEPDTDYIFVMGHSAGAAHTKVMTLYPKIRETLPPLKGLIWNAGPWFFSVEGEKFRTEGPVKFYFGSAEQQSEREPRALWNKLSDDEIKSLPDILLVQAEREPNWLQITGVEIMKDMERRLGKAPQRIVGIGHNHVSPNWALGSGQGEEWGYEVSKWLHERIGTSSS